VKELVEYVHPSRRGLLQRGLVCQQGEFSIVSVTASVQVLLIRPCVVKDNKYEGIQQANRRQRLKKGPFRQGESISKNEEVPILKTLLRAK
jgi:outer membrane protein assembly factor BamA